MTIRYFFAVFHLLALAIGIAAVYARWHALRKVKSTADLPAVFHADNWYGIAVIIWLVTGLARAFAGLEKGSDYYLGSHWFIGKMGLFLIVFAIEIYPMITFLRWRKALKKGGLIELGRTPTLARLTLIELVLLILMVFMASAMARGL